LIQIKPGKFHRAGLAFRLRGGYLAPN